FLQLLGSVLFPAETHIAIDFVESVDDAASQLSLTVETDHVFPRPFAFLLGFSAILKHPPHKLLQMRNRWFGPLPIKLGCFALRYPAKPERFFAFPCNWFTFFTFFLIFVFCI